jgi:hypothetical protein
MRDIWVARKWLIGRAKVTMPNTDIAIKILFSPLQKTYVLAMSSTEQKVRGKKATWHGMGTDRRQQQNLRCWWLAKALSIQSFEVILNTQLPFTAMNIPGLGWNIVRYSNSVAGTRAYNSSVSWFDGIYRRGLVSEEREVDRLLRLLTI